MSTGPWLAGRGYPRRCAPRLGSAAGAAKLRDCSVSCCSGSSPIPPQVSGAGGEQWWGLRNAGAAAIRGGFSPAPAPGAGASRAVRAEAAVV